MAHIKTGQYLEKNFAFPFKSISRNQEQILYKLFEDVPGWGEILKRLMIIDQPDCLDLSQMQYKKIVEGFNLKKLKDDTYVVLNPGVNLENHDEAKVHVYFSFGNATPSAVNPEYKILTLTVQVLCDLEVWELDDFKIRPWEITSMIVGILDNAKLSNVGKVQYIGSEQSLYSEVHYGDVVSSFLVYVEKADDTIKPYSNLPAAK